MHSVEKILINGIYVNKITKGDFIIMIVVNE